MTRSAALGVWASLLGCLAGCPDGGVQIAKSEICGDGQDNDGNGLTDCDDVLACGGQSGCVAFDFGNCAHCGQACTSQPSCVSSYLDERPIPLCTAKVCQAKETFIQPRIELDTRSNWGGVTLSPQSASTRFIKKTANDGTAVDCMTVLKVAADRTNAGAIEASQTFVIQGLDVTRVTNPNLGQGIAFSLVNTQTGGDYLIWLELWGGPPNSDTKLPTGRRLGYGCFVAAAETPALTQDDNCPSTTSDAGSCKVLRLKMPPPEG